MTRSPIELSWTAKKKQENTINKRIPWVIIITCWSSIWVDQEETLCGAGLNQGLEEAWYFRWALFIILGIVKIVATIIIMLKVAFLSQDLRVQVCEYNCFLHL